MNKSKAAIAIVGTLLASVVGIGIGSAAVATSGDEAAYAEGTPAVEGALALVPATTTQNGASFYDLEALARAWPAAVDAFNQGLPEGYSLARELPAGFQTLDPRTNIFEAQIVDMSIATDYRCAWLDAHSKGSASDEEVQMALDTYWTLPSVAKFDETGFDTDLEQISVELGYSDRDQALFDLTCNGWEN